MSFYYTNIHRAIHHILARYFTCGIAVLQRNFDCMPAGRKNIRWAFSKNDHLLAQLSTRKSITHHKILMNNRESAEWRNSARWRILKHYKLSHKDTNSCWPTFIQWALFYRRHFESISQHSDFMQGICTAKKPEMPRARDRMFIRWLARYWQHGCVCAAVQRTDSDT